LIDNFNKEFSTADIYLITTKKDIPYVQKKLGDKVVAVLGSDDIDFDQSIMINSDILVAAASTFSMIAGFLHKGSRVYTPKWVYFKKIGGDSRYDYSNWIILDNI